MKSRITQAELNQLAKRVGLDMQHDCGGFRVVQDGRALYPAGGICSTATKRECSIYLRGVAEGRKSNESSDSKRT